MGRVLVGQAHSSNKISSAGKAMCVILIYCCCCRTTGSSLTLVPAQGKDKTFNGFHGSESVDAAHREIRLVFEN